MFKVFKKIFKSLKKTFKKIGKKLKKGFGKVAKAFGKLGPLGTFALNFMVGMATAGVGGIFMQGLTNALGNMGTVGKFILNVGSKIKQAASFVKKGVGSVFNKISDGIEFGMNRVSQPFMKEGAKGLGSAFRDFVSKATKGFITPSDQGVGGVKTFGMGAEERLGAGEFLPDEVVGPLQDGVVVPAPDPYSPDAMLEAMGVQVEPNPQDLVDAAIAEQGSFGVLAPDQSLLSPTGAKTFPMEGYDPSKIQGEYLDAAGAVVDPLSPEGIRMSLDSSVDAAARPAVGDIAPPALPAVDEPSLWDRYKEAQKIAKKGKGVLTPGREYLAEERQIDQDNRELLEETREVNRARAQAHAESMLSALSADPLYHSPGIQYYNIADPMQSGIDPSQYDYGTNAYYGAFQAQANA